MSDWTDRLSFDDAAHLLRTAASLDLLDGIPAVVFHDLDRMQRRIAALQGAFPSNSLHAIAIKANPIVEVLRAVVSSGAGLEAASFEEVQLALAAGCQPAASCSIHPPRRKMNWKSQSN